MNPRPKSLEETLGAGLSLLMGDVPSEFLEDADPSAEPAIPPARPAAPFAAPAPSPTGSGEACVRCDGEGEVLKNSVVVPCPVCRGGRGDR